jgi:hypothetical protein
MAANLAATAGIEAEQQARGFLKRMPQVGGRLLDSLRAADAEAYALSCEALADFDVRARLGKIAVSVLAVAGA